MTMTSGRPGCREFLPDGVVALDPEDEGLGNIRPDARRVETGG
jgi:hypothetical protein